MPAKRRPQISPPTFTCLLHCPPPTHHPPDVAPAARLQATAEAKKKKAKEKHDEEERLRTEQEELDVRSPLRIARPDLGHPEGMAATARRAHPARTCAHTHLLRGLNSQASVKRALDEQKEQKRRAELDDTERKVRGLGYGDSCPFTDLTTSYPSCVSGVPVPG